MAQHVKLEVHNFVGGMEVEPNIENMTLEEYLKYKSEKESRLWRRVRSKGSPTRYEMVNVDSFHRDKSRTFDYSYYYENIKIDMYNELPLLHPCFQPPQPHTKVGLVPPNKSDEDITIEDVENNAYDAPATYPILDELLEEFGNELLDIVVVDEETGCNPTMDIAGCYSNGKTNEFISSHD
ncbi:hypothetical protein Tco_0816797 [Tanacetum coccineum]